MKVIVPLTLIGLVSGLLTAFLVADPSWAGMTMFLLPGLLFGVAIAAFFVVSGRERKAYKIIGFIGMSFAAYVIAFLVTFWLTLLTSLLPAASFVGFFFGGLCGAFLFLVGIKFLLFPIKDREWYSLSFIGGFLALLGVLAGYLWSFVVSQVSQYAQSSSSSLPFALGPLFVLWQTGMALALGIYIKKSVENVAPAMEVRTSEAPKAIAALGIVLTCFVLLFFIAPARDAYHAYEQGKAQDKAITAQFGPQPSLENLPDMTVVPAKEIMIDQPIGNYFSLELTPGVKEFSASGEQGSLNGSLTRKVVYKDEYSTNPQGPAWYQSADVPKVIAVVTQYPTMDWARYELKDFPSVNYIFTDGATETKINKFDNTIYLAGASSSYPTRDFGTYFWPSEDKVVTLSFFNAEDDEFIKEYLAKYPSDL